MQEHIVESAEDIAEFTTNLLVDTASDVSFPSAALPGGRSVLPVLEGIRRLPDEVLGKYTFYLVDERWERDFNGKMLEDELFELLFEEGRISRDRIRFPDVSRPIDRETREYERGLPVLSVVFLGVGEDGHVASLFPGHPILHAQGKTAYLSDSPKPPPMRLSLTLKALAQAGRRVLIFWGEGKAATYRRFLETDDWESIPASYFKGLDGSLILRDGRIGR